MSKSPTKEGDDEPVVVVVGVVVVGVVVVGVVVVGVVVVGVVVVGVVVVGVVVVGVVVVGVVVVGVVVVGVVVVGVVVVGVVVVGVVVVGVVVVGVVVVGVVVVGVVVSGADIGGAATPRVGSELAVAEPFLFDAITATTILEPTSAAVRPYVLAVPDVTAAHADPPASHLNHRNEKVEAGPLQAPAFAVRVCPCVTSPVIDGGVVFVGTTCPGGTRPLAAAVVAAITAAMTTKTKAAWRYFFMSA
ncbi:MAG: hypothetical protein WKF41_05040 [Gaiellaceae bacterium]